MTKLTKILALVSALALAASASASAPDRLGKSAARKLTSSMVDTCNKTDDALACLKDIGSECSPVGEGDDLAYSCVYELSVTATKTSHSESTPREWDFEATFLVKNGKKGWRAKTKSIREVKD